jgi:hypothetical protein
LKRNGDFEDGSEISGSVQGVDEEQDEKEE